MKAIFKVRLSVNLFLAFSVFYIIIYESILIYEKELFPGAARLGVIWKQLCLAVIASYIFYFLVVHLVRLRDQDNIYKYVADKVHDIVSLAHATFTRLTSKTSLSKAQWPPKLKQIEGICSKIRLGDKSPLLIINAEQKFYATWIQYLEQLVVENRNAIEKIFIHMIFLDSKLVKLLGGIDNCHFFKKIEYIKLGHAANISCTVIANDLYDYFRLIHNLEIFACKCLNQYRLKKEC